MGATPRPPPTSTTVPSSLRMWLGKPSGPMKSRIVSPSRSANISKVVLPTAWTPTLTGPAPPLDHHRDRPGPRVEICNGQRDPFPMLVNASHDKVSGTRRSRHIGRFHVPEEGCWTKLYPTTDEKHHTP